MKAGGPGLWWCSFACASRAWAMKWPRSASITGIARCIRAITRSAAIRILARRSSTPAIACSHWAAPSAGLIASWAAAFSSADLSGKTRKMVPSATPAA